MLFNLADIWGCIPMCERTANLVFGSAVNTLTPFIPKSFIDALFQVAFPSWWEIRLEAYLQSYEIESAEEIIDEETVAVYLVNRIWMLQVGACILLGGCNIAEPRCEIFTWYEPA